MNARVTPARTPASGIRADDVIDDSIDGIVRDLVSAHDILDGEPLTGFRCSAEHERETTVVRRVALITPTRHIGVYVKSYRPAPATGIRERSAEEQAESEFRELQRVERAFAGAAGVGIIRPLAYLPRSRSIVTREAAGVPLGTLIAHQARRFRRTISEARLVAIGANIAEWLHRFQSLAPPQTIEVDELRRYCIERLERLERAPHSGFSARDSARVIARFDQLAGRLTLDDRLAVDLHADFTTENILVDGDKVTVLDFVGGRRGLRVHDLAHLVMQLDVAGRKPWIDATAIRQLQGGLMRGYDPSLSRTSPALQVALMANVLARLVHRTSMRGPWLQRQYSRHLWRELEREVLGGAEG